jgi:hypothetical protein
LFEPQRAYEACITVSPSHPITRHLGFCLIVTGVIVPWRGWQADRQTHRTLLIGYAVAAIPIELLLLGLGGIYLTLIGFA